MKRYRCKKKFCVDNYDEDGYLIENSSTIIEEGKVYELDESGCMMVGGKNHVHLDAVDGNSWIEITKDHLEEYFGRLKADKDCNGCFGASFNDCQRCPPSNKQDQIQDNQIDQITYGCKEEQKLFEEAKENE